MDPFSEASSRADVWTIVAIVVLFLAYPAGRWVTDRRQATTARGGSGAAGLIDESAAHAAAGRFRECLDVANRAIALDPSAATAFNNAGYCAAKLELWEQGVASTREAIRLDPGLELAKRNLAWMERERDTRREGER